MDNRIIEEVLKELGPSGMRRLAQVLSGDHNNWKVAKQFGLTLWQVRYLAQFNSVLCHFVLTEEKKNPVILEFKQSA